MTDDEQIATAHAGSKGRFRLGIARLPGQLMGRNPFDGDSQPSRVKLFHPGAGRPALPFPHPWNYTRPIEILETFFCQTDQLDGPARNNRYLEVPGFAPILVSRDPGIIRAILHATGDGPGKFDRDTLPSTGIARATGEDTLLYANGPLWKLQRKLAAPSFNKSKLFQPERFQEFEDTFRHTIAQRLEVLRSVLAASGQPSVQLALEPEIKVVMLEMLANNFFGAEIPYEEIRDRFAPSLQRVIDHIVSDTVVNRLGIPIQRMPNFTGNIAQVKAAFADFEELTDRVLAPREAERGLWKQFKSDAPDEKLRSNIRVFLAGALEATTSFAAWAIAHLARHPEIQERVYQEVKAVDSYTPDNLKHAKELSQVLDETLRLTPSLYFLPRKATADTWVEAADGRKMYIPNGTHVLLDVWHANRLEDYWGVENTGYPAADFAPDRWAVLAERGLDPKSFLHFGFGHGPRVCPGKFLGQLEVGLVVGAIVKTFRFRSVDAEDRVKAGVSTKPVDGAQVELALR
ncbi:MAG: cytochrome P450 [Verrucomicrobiales bacterium]